MYAKGNTQLNGYFDSEKNTVFVTHEQTPERAVHTFFHELIHYQEAETSRLTEEDRCDLIGSYLMKLTGTTNLEEFLARVKVTTKDKPRGED